MNETIHCSRPSRSSSRRRFFSAWSGSLAVLSPLAVMSLLAWGPEASVFAQPPQGAPGYGPSYQQGPAYYNPQGPGSAYPLPTPQQYYEYLPPDRGFGDYGESPLDRLLKQSLRQTYGRLEYLKWGISNPGSGVIGGPGKKLLDGEGFQTPSFLDPIRGQDLADISNALYPIRRPLLKTYPNSLVMIQVWESNQLELTDLDADGNIYDIIDANLDGINDDDNDLDIFPRVTNQAKSDMLSGLDPNIFFSTGLPDDAAQVAVVGIGQLANSNAFELDQNNGFRGVVGLETSFGALETSFLMVDRARSGFQYQPIPPGFLEAPFGGPLVGGAPADPLVIPVLVNGQMAPNVFDAAGNLITDSNNYYIIFNDSYQVDFSSESWGFSPQILFTMYERPDRFRLSSKLGFRYFDFREQMLQQGSFSNDDSIADLTYENEIGTDFASTINSTTQNRVWGPQAGIRAELGDERLAFGFDANLMLGANTHEAIVAVDDLLFVGDDNFTRDTATEFAAGFEMLVDARIKVVEHVSLTVGYNFLWFSGITRPHNNIYYNINADRINAPALGGPDYIINNDVVVDKRKQNVTLSGLSVGVVIDW